MISSCPVLARYRLVMSGSCACLSFLYVQNLPAVHAFAVVGLHNLPSIFWLFFGLPFFYDLPHLEAGPCLTMCFAFLQPTLFSATISCHITLSFLLWSCCESAFFPLAHRPKDPGSNSCILVDWTWFTAAKYGLITNQVVRKSYKSPQGKNAIPPKQ